MPNKSPGGPVNPPALVTIVGSRRDLPILIPSDDEAALPPAPRIGPFTNYGATRSEPINLVSDDGDDEDTRSARKDLPKSVVAETVKEMTRIVIERAQKRKRERSSSPPAPLARVAEQSAGLRPTKFPGRVDMSLAMGSHLSLTNEEPGCAQRLFVACSVIGDCAAVGVVWKKPGPIDDTWNGEGFHVPYRVAESLAANIFAVVKALRIAAERIQSSTSAGIASPEQPYDVLISSDSVAALERIERYDTVTGAGAFSKSQRGKGRPKFKEALDDIMAAGEALCGLGAKIELQLVPAHSGVSGCIEAHRRAKRTANLMVERQAMAARLFAGAKSNHASRNHR